MGYQSAFRPGLFAGKVVIVTGGASGIGRCTAHELASLGATVAIIDLDRATDKLAAVKKEIEDDGGKAITGVCDIREEAAVCAVVDQVLAEAGRIDGLFNNAGGQFPGPMKGISTKGFEAVVKNNLTGGFIFMREVYTRWMEANGGAIVNTVADMWMGWPGYAHSGAARAGMHNLTESAACEWAASGVRVNSIAPGGIMSSAYLNYPPAVIKETLKYPENIPLQRFGTVSEISATVTFLLSPAAAYITGTCIRVDGGGPNARRPYKLQPHSRSIPFDGFHRNDVSLEALQKKCA